MELKALELENWRNNKKLSLCFDKINILKGPNASGKTNILEAIYFLATGKSFRTKDENLIKWDESFSRTVGTVRKDKKDEELLVVLEKRQKVVKTVKIKGQKVASSKLLGQLNCVLFTPEEIELISTLPEARRRYLNLIIGQTNRQYATNLIHYRRTLEQRNSLLRRINEGISKLFELEIWDGRLAEFGSQIIEEREKYVGEINQTLSQNYLHLSKLNQKLELRYLSTIENGWAGFISKLTATRERDVYSRVTNVGPHRDDFVFLLDGKDLNEFASRGEFRTAILALKLSEVAYFEKATGERPLLLLDDVFSELDESRRDLLSQIFENQQTIVTTTDLDHVSNNILEKSKVLELS